MLNVGARNVKSPYISRNKCTNSIAYNIMQFKKQQNTRKNELYNQIKKYVISYTANPNPVLCDMYKWHIR